MKNYINLLTEEELKEFVGVTVYEESLGKGVIIDPLQQVGSNFIAQIKWDKTGNVGLSWVTTLYSDTVDFKKWRMNLLRVK